LAALPLQEFLVTALLLIGLAVVGVILAWQDDDRSRF
jgi:hypothetical protein